jgi:hypothetical protein
MEISLENLRSFAHDYGAVSIMDSTGKVRKLFGGEPDVWELILKADRFHYGGAWYSREDFEKLMGTMTTKPGNISQISLKKV